jgi:hypothetical protein
MAQPTYYPATSVIVTVSKTNTVKGLRYLCLCEDGTKHWFSPKYVENVMFANDLDRLSPIAALRGATVVWEEASVKAGDVVYDDKTGAPVEVNGKPRLFLQDGKRVRNTNLILSDDIVNRVFDAEVAERTKVKFSGAALIAMYAPQRKTVDSTPAVDSIDDIVSDIENAAGIVTDVPSEDESSDETSPVAKGKKAPVTEPLAQ